MNLEARLNAVILLTEKTAQFLCAYQVHQADLHQIQHVQAALQPVIILYSELPASAAQHRHVQEEIIFLNAALTHPVQEIPVQILTANIQEFLLRVHQEFY